MGGLATEGPDGEAKCIGGRFSSSSEEIAPTSSESLTMNTDRLGKLRKYKILYVTLQFL